MDEKRGITSISGTALPGDRATCQGDLVVNGGPANKSIANTGKL